MDQPACVAEGELAGEVPPPHERPGLAGLIDDAHCMLAAADAGEQRPHLVVQPAVAGIIGAGDEKPAGR